MCNWSLGVYVNCHHPSLFYWLVTGGLLSPSLSLLDLLPSVIVLDSTPIAFTVQIIVLYFPLLSCLSFWFLVVAIVLLFYAKAFNATPRPWLLKTGFLWYAFFDKVLHPVFFYCLMFVFFFLEYMLPSLLFFKQLLLLCYWIVKNKKMNDLFYIYLYYIVN